MSEQEPAKVFISYSWSSPEHEEWVLQLALELVDSGVMPIIDKWDLRPGEDAAHFMERMVNDETISKVIMVCDRIYKEKADKRQGGAGTEAQILSAELYRSSSNAKFCAVIAETVDGKAPIPTYYASRIYIDLSDETKRSEKFEELIRWLFNKPLLVRPAIGSRPSYLNDDASSIRLGTASRARRALDAVKTHKPFWKDACQEYFELMTTHFENLRIKTNDSYIEQFVKSIEDFIPYRDEILELVKAIAAQNLGPDSVQVVHRFFEGILPYTRPTEEMNQWLSNQFDNFGFIIYELFIMVMADLIKREQFAFAEALLRDNYILSPRFMTNETTSSFQIFQRLSMGTLDTLQNQMGERKVSFRAFLITTKRLSNTGITAHDLAQADLVLGIRARATNQFWWPDHLVYAERYRTLIIFSRSISKRFFDSISPMLGVDLATLKSIVKQVDDEGGFFKGIMYFGPKISELIAEDKLCTST